ncbi:MAG: PDZ domain-containing protein [Flavobacterium sp.]
MRLRLFFILLLVSAFSFAQPGFQFESPRNRIAIPFKFINNLIFIPVIVNGEELTFLLDTGVEQTILFSLDEKEEVKLFEVEKLKLRGLGSKEPIDSYRSSRNKVEVGDFIDYQHEIYIILDQEFNFSSQVGIEVNGIMGYNFFKNHIIEIDYEKKKIFAYNHENKKLKARLQKKFTKDSITIEENKPYCVSNIVSEGKMIASKLLIDSGNSDALWIFVNKTDKIKLPKNIIPDYLGRGFSGSVFGKRGRVASFEFGRKTFDAPLVTFPDSASVKSVKFVPNRVGSIGSEVLSRFTVVFDYQDKLIYTKPNDHINDPFHFNMSGIEVEHAGLEWVQQSRDNHSGSGIKIYTDSKDEQIQNNLKVHFELKPIFRIASVREGSEAEKAGLKVGDRIIRINHQNAHGFTMQAINELLKSEEGKTIDMEVERNEKTFKYHFKLKKII